MEIYNFQIKKSKVDWDEIKPILRLDANYSTAMKIARALADTNNKEVRITKGSLTASGTYIRPLVD